MSIARIKKDDKVIVTKGAYKGQTGDVMALDRAAGTAIVKGINLKRRAVRPNAARPSDSGFVSVEAPIALANLMPYDSEAKKGVRIARVVQGDKKVRQAKGTGRILE